MTFVVKGQAKGTMAALETRRENVAEALEAACRYINSGLQNVSIRDQSGNEISGDDLEACCNGVKTLTDDLMAI